MFFHPSSSGVSSFFGNNYHSRRWKRSDETKMHIWCEHSPNFLSLPSPRSVQSLMFIMIRFYILTNRQLDRCGHLRSAFSSCTYDDCVVLEVKETEYLRIPCCSANDAHSCYCGLLTRGHHYYYEFFFLVGIKTRLF